MAGNAEPGEGFAYGELEQWSEWSRSRRRVDSTLRQVKGLARPQSSPESPRPVLILPSGVAEVLVVAEMFTASCRAAIIEPIQYLDQATTAVLTYEGSEADMLQPGARRLPYDGPADLPTSLRVVLSLGAYLHLSEPLVEWSEANSARFVLVQHGLLTPFSPPAPHACTVLTWSESDLAFWGSGRSDLRCEVVGSQLLWNAQDDGEVVLADSKPVVLGQLHGSELSRRDAFHAYWSFCRSVDSDYRPHPNENDAISRALHALLRAGKVNFEASGLPLTQLARPVVSIFSTGTLEAAMRGVPAWVYHPDPPAWVRDFWKRYALAEYGSTPTQAWVMPAVPPAHAVASYAASCV